MSILLISKSILKYVNKNNGLPMYIYIYIEKMGCVFVTKKHNKIRWLMKIWWGHWGRFTGLGELGWDPGGSKQYNSLYRTNICEYLYIVCQN